MIQEFVKFIKRGNVIDLAIAVILGGAFGAIVNSLVNDLFMPLIGILIGGINFTGLMVKVGSAELKYGNFIQALVNFLLIALALFFVVKAMNAFRKKEEAAPPPPAEKPADVVLLEEIRDLLKKQEEKLDESGMAPARHKRTEGAGGESLIEADVAVIGGGFGGTAAALAAAESGLQVVLSEATDWIGGQATAQGVSALDEHAYIERFGGTRSYYRFREAVRELYRERLRRSRPYVGRRAAQPGQRLGLGAMFRAVDRPAGAGKAVGAAGRRGRLRILLEHVPLSAAVRGSHLQSGPRAGPGGARGELRAALCLDATELGDLLPLSGAPYARGAEAAADTGEPHAPADGAHPERVQSFTTCFFVAFHPGEDHTIPRPQGYEAWRDRQPFTLALRAADGTPRRFFMFTGEQPFWTYRRVLDARLFRAAGAGRAPARDIALINWDSIDYYKGKPD